MGIGVVLGSFTLQCLLSLGFSVYLRMLNRIKEQQVREASDHQEDSAAHAFADLTDKEVCYQSLGINPETTKLLTHITVE